MVRLVAVLAACASVILPAQGPLFTAAGLPAPEGLSPVNAAGDIDGDGDADVVNWNGIHANDGNGRFTLVPGTPTFWSRPLLADFDGDGILDGADFMLDVRIRRNLGAFSFAKLTTIPISEWNWSYIPKNLAAGDVDGDGDVDLLVGTRDYVWSNDEGPILLWLNDGAGGFSLAPDGRFPDQPLPSSIMALRDLDADGDLDALCSGYSWMQTGVPQDVLVAWNTGGSFALQSTPLWSGTGVFAIELGHFNADSFPDLVLFQPHPTPGLSVMLGSAAGFLQPVLSPTVEWATPAAIDVTGDGIDELVCTEGNRVTLRAVSPTGSVGPPIQTWPGLALGLMTPGSYGGAPVPSDLFRDLDGDGDRDVIAKGPAFLMNAGNGSLVRIDRAAAGVTIQRSQQILDANSDGILDLVGIEIVDDTTVMKIATGLGDANGDFVPGPVMQLPLQENMQYCDVHAFDRDGDGDADFYVRRFNASTDLVFDNVAGTTVQFTTYPARKARIIAHVDLDGDLDQDLLMAWRYPPYWGAPIPPFIMLQNAGNAGFLEYPIDVGRYTYDIDFGDFDGNGFVDVFLTNNWDINGSAAGGIDPCVLYLNFWGTLTPHVVTGVSGFKAVAGDVNGDGFADVIVGNQILLSTGTGSFVPGVPLVSLLTKRAALADVDLDGDLDIVMAVASVMRNDGSGAFGAVEHFLTPGGSNDGGPYASPAPEVFDIDRDGDLDIVSPGPFVALNMTRQIALGSRPRPARPGSIELGGTAVGNWLLFASTGTAELPAAPHGTVLIDPASALLFAAGTFPGPLGTPGIATVTAMTPASQALVGWTSYWQAIDLGTLHLTNRLAVTVGGY